MIKFKWYFVNKDYIDYLKKYDKFIQNINYGENALKPYVGIVFKINNFNYFAPISSMKNKYQNLKEDKDLIKIKSNKKVLGIINLNNMLPITLNQVQELKFNNIEQFRKFKNGYEKEKYISLLNRELVVINKRSEEIIIKSKFIYFEKINNPNSNLSKRCCNFKLLEEKCQKYENEHLIEKYKYN